MPRIAPSSNQRRGRGDNGRLRTLISMYAALLFAVCLARPMVGYGQAIAASSQDPTEMLDRVIAVVNNQAILQSDLSLEMRLYQLLPIGDAEDATPARTLERLTTRALIEQQIVQEDPKGMDVSPEELESSLTELRQNLPACKHRDCASTAGWADYLSTLGLTTGEVDHYWSNRVAILRFIEQRFRSGIRIASEEIEKYYREQVVPRYIRPEDAPALDRLSPRIQEILLQQQVNVLMNDWLKSLQQQGEVEVLDPALRMPGSPAGAAGAGSDGVSAGPAGVPESQLTDPKVPTDRKDVPGTASSAKNSQRPLPEEDDPGLPNQRSRKGGSL